MASFFSLNAVLPRSSSNPSHTHAARRDDEAPNPSNMTGPSRKRTAYTPSDEAVPPPASAQFVSGRQRTAPPPPPPFDLARSPPNGNTNKNTKHVPCKFFRQGTCQAGSACPFSHSLDLSTQVQPCKYFMKGTCKFGAKCALAHVYPDGSLANRPNRHANPGINGMKGMNGINGINGINGVNGINIHELRAGPPPYHHPDLALSNSILTQQQKYPDLYPPQFPYPEPEDPESAFHDRYAHFRNAIPTIDGGFASPPGSHFGSPPDDTQFPRSPVEHLRTALNAPMPQSFDSNGVSHIAQYGPLGHSVPDKFGMQLPPPSLPKKTAPPADAVSTLKSSAFASNSTLRSSSSNLLLAASPQPASDVYSPQQRPMHSTLRAARSKGLSSSVPQNVPLDDWEDSFGFDADLLPNSVRDEVLTPQDKMRRTSRTESEINTSLRDQSNGLAIPSGGSSKVGSPNMASSPSRYRAIFEQQQQQKREQEGNATNASSTIGRVGSPLRESWLPHGSGTSPRSGPLSGLSQQMARMQLTRTDSTESNGTSGTTKLQPPIMRNPSARFDRTLSSPGFHSPRIDEEAGGEPEPEGLLFSMDEDASKRSSLSLNAWARSPQLGPMTHDAAVGTAAAMPKSKPVPIEVRNGANGARNPWS